MLLAFSMQDPGAAARVIKDFAKANQALQVKVVAMGGKMFGPEDLERLASMPTKEQAISMLMALMKAPVEKLARTINEVPGKLVRTVAAIRDQKQDAA
jgi:large subunit ribosomal protein L10